MNGGAISGPRYRSDCAALRERLSALLEGRLGRSERAAAAEHLLACPACRRRRDGLQDLLAELQLLARAQSAPPWLQERILRQVPAPPASPRPLRAARSLAWRRAASWAVVFLGAWWQLVGARYGPQVANQVADGVAPVAGSFVASFQQAKLEGRALLSREPAAALERGTAPGTEPGTVPGAGAPALSAGFDRAGRGLAAFNEGLHRFLFVSGEASPRPSNLQPSAARPSAPSAAAPQHRAPQN